jgi:rare lipoprotein A
MNNFICICGLLLVGLLAPQAPSPRPSNSEVGMSSGHRAGAKAHHKARRANRKVHPGTLRGNASWYGRRFEGKKTASGTTFHADGHTAAAKNIPLGSTVKVTNLKNGRSARVKVTDRGPRVPGRVVDVSKGTAEQLGMTEQGVTPVTVTVVKPPPPKTDAATSEPD